MRKVDLQTPAILVDLDVLEQNIRKYQKKCDERQKKLWPMVKTHKSTALVQMQLEAGADGFLCGTLDECESIAALGIDNIMYAYPAASEVNLARIIDLAKRCKNFIIRLDGLEAAERLNKAAAVAGVVVHYTLIVDSGLHRFGVVPEHVGVLLQELTKLHSLHFLGFSTHPGHVYGAKANEEIAHYVTMEETAIQTAELVAGKLGFVPELRTSGSTPTFAAAVEGNGIDIFHPGNYVFHDRIQMSLGVAAETDCALTVLATVISHTAEGRFVMDAGAKCLGLDQGAHSGSTMVGFGYVKGHPELTITGLSEEVGKLQAIGPTSLHVGAQIEIIPNHACSAANMTDYLVGCRQSQVERLIEVDMRGNCSTKGWIIS